MKRIIYYYFAISSFANIKRQLLNDSTLLKLISQKYEKSAMKYFIYNNVDFEMAYKHKKNDLPNIFFTHVYKSSSAELTSVFQFQIYGESQDSYILQLVISS